MAILILGIVLLAIGAAVALVRGLVAFAHIGEDLRNPDPDAHLVLGRKANRMMSQRVLFQGLAILAIALLGALFSGR